MECGLQEIYDGASYRRKCPPVNSTNLARREKKEKRIFNGNDIQNILF